MASRNQEGDYRYASRVQTNMEQCLLRRSCSCCMWCVWGRGRGGGYQQCDWSIISSFTMYLLTMSFGCHLAGEVSALLC